MKRAETVLFASSGLDRAAGMRRDDGALTSALDAGAGVLPLWRGKPMVTGVAEGAAPGDGAVTLAFRPMGHPVLAKAAEAPVFLGLGADEEPLFACDISGWVPPEVDEDQVGGFVDASLQHHPSEDATGAAFAELRRIMTHLSPREAELAATARGLLEWHRTHLFCARCGARSDLAEAGWQRACPACGARHFPRTDPVVIMLITDGERVLLGRSPGWPDRMYSLLAGFIEPGETVEGAVRREVFEEAGIEVGAVGYLSSQPWPFPASLMLGCRGVAISDRITVDREELEDARWVTRSDLLEVFAGRHPDIAPARRGAIAHFLLEHWLSDRLD
ncbi:NADH pyrophosphatase [Roseibacterium elongatum DSM 19469]|uniref:NAD(+) diphosphatase n=1 Tax=Roseicyclus elongatus DSM 19469 TaxID=1294273 RepID=W8SKN8_9RHOB|nr:NAD(+) diphosphatase [Roseibacterium elongatum]AHM03085.1 NADH pyrophosphatase [Roseibacterium elongatum DSM 19469]